MKITEKQTKEVEVITGYKCDCCGKFMNRDEISENDFDGGYVKYLDGIGLYSGVVTNHFCSIECLKIILRNVPFDCDIHLSNKLIEEFMNNE